MIKKLRRKFILVNMLLVTLVLLIVFGALLGFTYQRLQTQSTAALRMALEWGEGGKPPLFEIGRPEPRRDEERQLSVLPAFSVRLDENGEVAGLYGGSVTVSDEVVREAVAEALAREEASGAISSLDLRYLRQERPDGTRIAFVHTAYERESLLSFVLTALLVGAGGLACFFAISLLLSAIALRPVKAAWEQQRQFVADASHELRTPLTVILTNAGILLAHREDTVGAQIKWVEYIQAEAQRMKGLVEDLLFLAKHDDARGARPVRQTIRLSELATGCVLLFESVAFEAGVTLDSDVAPGLTLPGDEEQLRRLAVILLDNACKYAGRGGAVKLTLARCPDGLALAVHNTGEPIPAEHLPRLFERFYRTDGGRSRDTGGFGLGLAIAKSIADAHRADISVASAAGEGTTFTVRFPA